MRTVLPVDSMVSVLLGGSLMAKIVILAATTTKVVKIAPLVALKMEMEAIVALMTVGPSDTMANVDLTEKVGGVDAVAGARWSQERI